LYILYYAFIQVYKKKCLTEVSCHSTLHFTLLRQCFPTFPPYHTSDRIYYTWYQQRISLLRIEVPPQHSSFITPNTMYTARQWLILEILCALSVVSFIACVTATYYNPDILNKGLWALLLFAILCNLYIGNALERVCRGELWKRARLMT
jgi:hypothetical protein